MSIHFDKLGDLSIKIRKNPKFLPATTSFMSVQPSMGNEIHELELLEKSSLSKQFDRETILQHMPLHLQIFFRP